MERKIDMPSIQVYMNTRPERWSTCLHDKDRILLAYEDFAGKVKLVCMPPKETRCLAYIVPAESSIETLLQGLSIFNEMNAEVLVYASSELCRVGRQFSNTHISFMEFTLEEIVISAHVFITWSAQAIFFIRKMVPLMILGPAGIGGWVTPKNLPFLLQNGFQGRPGGNTGESVPLMLWLEEMKLMENSEVKTDWLLENQRLLDESPWIPASAVPSEIVAIHDLHTAVCNIDSRWKLKPRLCSNITTLVDQDAIYFKRIGINDTLGVCPTDMLPLLEIMDGKIRGEDLLLKFALERDGFSDFLGELYEAGIIAFEK